MTGNINPLAQILSVYKERIEEVSSKKTIIAKVIQSHCGVLLVSKEIELSENTLFIKSHPAKRQVIFFKKNEILEELHKAQFSFIVDIK